MGLDSGRVVVVETVPRPTEARTTTKIFLWYLSNILCAFLWEKINKVKIQLSCVSFLFQWRFQCLTLFGDKKKILRKSLYTKHYWKFYYGLVLSSLRVKGKNALMGHLELYRKMFLEFCLLVFNFVFFSTQTFRSWIGIKEREKKRKIKI